MVTLTTTTGSSPSVDSATEISFAANRYEFKQLIHHGRTGSIYAALDRMTNAPATIKLLPYDLRKPSAREKFETRASTLCGIRHPNLIEVIDYGYHYGLAYLVESRDEAATLEDMLRARGPLSWKTFSAIFDALIQALQVAYDNDLVHGDVQPSHTLVVTHDDVIQNIVLTGFGFPDLANENVTIAEDTVHASSVDAIAPEKLLSHPCDHRLDLYALGATAYELLSGVQPFSGRSMGRVFKSVYEPPPPLKNHLPDDHNVPESAINLIMELLEKSPEARPNSAHQVSFWFRSTLEGDVPTLASLRVPTLSAKELHVARESQDIRKAMPRFDDTEPGDPARARTTSKKKSKRSKNAQGRRITRPPPTIQISPFREGFGDINWKSPQVLFQLAGLFFLFLIFAGVGILVVVQFHSSSDDPSTVESALVSPDSADKDLNKEESTEDEIQSLFHRIDDSLNERRYGTAQDLIERLEARKDFPSDLRGTLQAYRSRLDFSSQLNRAKRLESTGKNEEALLVYWNLSQQFPEHASVPDTLGSIENSFVLKVSSEVRGVVIIDDEPIGITPFTGLIPANVQRVAVARKGHRTWETAIAAQKGTRLNLEAKLEKRSRSDKPDRKELDLNASPFMDLMEMKLE